MIIDCPVRKTGQSAAPPTSIKPFQQGGLPRETVFAGLGMDAVGADQDVTAHRVHVGAAPVEEIGGHPAFVLGNRPSRQPVRMASAPSRLVKA